MARYEISGISLSSHGIALAKKILPVLESNNKLEDMAVRWYHRPEEIETVEEPFIVLDESLAEWVDKRFKDSNILIFIGNISRVFMLTAPYAADYANSMAILVIDEFGRFCIPLLCGRRNEGMELADVFSKELHITAVDMLSAKKGHDFSIERFAKENRMTISNTDYAREIMTSLDAGETVGLYTNYRFTGALPLGMEFTDSGEKGVYISPSYRNAYFDRTLWLIPRCMIVDLECAQKTLPYTMLSAVDKIFRKLNLFQEAVEMVRLPEKFTGDSLVMNFCRDREIILKKLDKFGKGPEPDENGFEYQAICDMETEEGIRCRVSVKNIVLHFLG